MVFLKGFLLFVEFTTCVLLICVVLLQKSKSGGGLGAIGGGMGEAIFGAQMGNVLTRTTVILAVIFLVNTTVLALLGSRGSEVPRVGSGAPAAAAPATALPPVAPGPAAPTAGVAPMPLPPVEAIPAPATPADAAGTMPEPVVIPETPAPAPAN